MTAGPRDTDEAATRTAYARAAAAALGLVERLACSPDAEAPAAVHRVPAGLRHWTPNEAKAQILHTSRRAAVEAGWLVEARALGTPEPGETGQLRALELAVKDLVDVAGFVVRNGTPGALWRRPVESAPAWNRLERAGARCAGIAATHEMAWGLTTPAIGNPHDPRRFAGGSSGGSGAVVAAGAVHGAIGTDTSGSIRVPAALCGVVGIRPTHGSVPSGGVTPMAPSQDVVGPMAPDVDTCALLLEVLQDRALGDGPTAPAAWRLGVLADPGPLDHRVTRAYAQTLGQLATQGVDLVVVDENHFPDAGALSVLTMLTESAVLYASAVRRYRDGFGGEFRGITAVGAAILAERPDIARVLHRARHAARVRTEDLFASHQIDAFLTPTVPCVAPLRSERTVRLGSRDVPVATALSRFTAWSAVSGWPAISVPVAGAAMPVGMQVMAPPHREDVCLAVGILITSRGD